MNATTIFRSNWAHLIGHSFPLTSAFRRTATRDRSGSERPAAASPRNLYGIGRRDPAFSSVVRQDLDRFGA